MLIRNVKQPMLKGMLQTGCLNPLTVLPNSQGNAVHDSGLPEIILNCLKLELTETQERAWLTQPSWGAEPGPDKSPHGGGVAAARLLAVNQLAPAQPTQGGQHKPQSLCFFFVLRPTTLTHPVTSADTKVATGGCTNFALLSSYLLLWESFEPPNSCHQLSR